MSLPAGEQEFSLGGDERENGEAAEIELNLQAYRVVANEFFQYLKT